MPDRTTIVMPPELKERAVRQARELNMSFGAFVRLAVERQLPAEPRKVKFIKPIRGKTGDPFWDNWVAFDDGGPTDMSVNHDKYLYEALEDELRRHGHFSRPVSPKRPASRGRRPVVANPSKPRAHKQSRAR